MASRKNTLIVPAVKTSSSSSSDKTSNDPEGHQYHQTLMYGQYSKDLGEYAKEEARKAAEDRKRVRAADAQRARELSGASKTRGRCYRRSARVVTWVWKHTFAKVSVMVMKDCRNGYSVTLRCKRSLSFKQIAFATGKAIG